MKNKCYECRNYLGCGYDAETQACHNFMPKGKTTVFDRLISSPEVLAKVLVFCNVTVREHPGGVELTKGWYSTIIRKKVWSNEEEAISATVEKLKEVCNG